MSEAAQATAADAPPLTRELLASLAADYNAGRMPDDVKERFEALRDEYFDRFDERVADMKADVQGISDAPLVDLMSQVQAIEADGGIVNSEVIDSRMVPIVSSASTLADDGVVQPVIEAFEDVTRTNLDIASELLQLRADHDPDGMYAEKVDAAQAELERIGEAFDNSMHDFHELADAQQDTMDQLRDDAESFHQHHAPVQIIMSTTVDPHLPEQMNEETGEGAA